MGQRNFDLISAINNGLAASDSKTRINAVRQFTDAARRKGIEERRTLEECFDLSLALPALCAAYRASSDSILRGSVLNAIFALTGWVDVVVGDSGRFQVHLGELVLPTLIQALQDRDLGNRTTAVFALRDLEFAARDAVPALLDARSDRNFNPDDFLLRMLQFVSGLNPEKTYRDAIDDILDRFGID